jgi:pimeloyl-ACP methyl ester carboxylesterase
MGGKKKEQTAARRCDIATFVLVHGGFCGGWIWHDVSSLLRSAGHDVFTPSLTGMGDRVHLAQPDTDLDTHIQDIVMVMSYEDLRDVILVGHSYAGMVITGVAEKVPERLAHIVYFDAFVPQDGQSFFDMVGEEGTAEIRKAADADGDGWRVPSPDWDSRLTDQPLKTALQPVRVENANATNLPRTFIHCTQRRENMGMPGIPIIRAAKEIKEDKGWRYRELDRGHLAHLEAPREVTELLLELV